VVGNIYKQQQQQHQRLLTLITLIAFRGGQRIYIYSTAPAATVTQATNHKKQTAPTPASTTPAAAPAATATHCDSSDSTDSSLLKMNKFRI